MKNDFLEAGQIVNTHGISGEVKILSWCDSPEVLCGFKTIYIDQKPVNVKSCRPCKGSVLAKLDGIDDINAAMCLKGKTVLVTRDSVPLPAGRHFLSDLIGLEARDANSGAVLGTLTDILSPSAQLVYVITDGEQEHLVPAVEAFIAETNTDEGFIRINLIEGL
ncbi:MAG: ribosome maturation factor RimM [Oscillospiraceae bacterium]